MKHKKYHLIYFFSLLFFILSLVSTTTAQTSYLDSLDGKFALQFQISENFTLTNFQGATLSGKYHLGKRSAIRLGLSLNFDDSDSDREITLSDSLNYNENAENNSVGFTISSQYLNYLVRTDDIGFYLGAGPTIGFANSETEFNLVSSDSTINNGSGSGDTFTIGLDAIVGVEWSFHKDMTLSAEYGMKFYYRHRTDKLDSTASKYERTSDSLRLTANYINFGITVYF
jgi:opacity protein-like surface antigen